MEEYATPMCFALMYRARGTKTLTPQVEFQLKVEMFGKETRSSLSFLCLFFTLLFQCEANCGKKGSDIVEVLLWTGGSWAGFTSGDYFRTPNYLGHEVDKTQWDCPLDCRFTTDKRRLSKVDGVIFEAQPITGYYDDYKRSPPNFPQKYPYQSWINHGYESHEYFNLYGDPGYMDFIDVNFTFYLDSQVPITFTCMWGGGEMKDFLQPPPPKSKDKCVVFMATNCAAGGATARTIYTQELMKYIHIDSFGKCLHNKDLPKEMQFPIYSDHGSSMRNKVNIFSQYKFVLTFENNNITDYVTGANDHWNLTLEKLINVLQAGAVPIYMGAPNVHPYWTPGENSIIQTDHFKSPKELASYIQRLCDDDQEYMKYFEWKKKGFSKHFEQRFNDCAFYGAECRLCQHLHAKRNLLSPEEATRLHEQKEAPSFYYILKLAGGSQFLRVDSSPAFDFGKTFSILLWIKPQRNKGTLVSRGPLTFSLASKDHRNYLELCLGEECWLGMREMITDGWYHVGVTFHYDPNPAKSFLRFFVNGEPDDGIEIPTKFVSGGDYNSEPLFLGTKTLGSHQFVGLIDDISLWDITLTPSQMRDYLWKLPSGLEGGLVAYWGFNHAIGSVAHDITGAHPATVLGNPTWEESLTRPLITSNPCL